MAPGVASAQDDADRAAATSPAQPTTDVDGPNAPTIPTGTGTPPAPQRPSEAEKTRNTRYFGVYRVDPERYSRDLTRLSQEILQQLAALDGVDLEVTVEVHARREEGFTDDKVRVVSENARTLRFEQSSRPGCSNQRGSASTGPSEDDVHRLPRQEAGQVGAGAGERPCRLGR